MTKSSESSSSPVSDQRTQIARLRSLVSILPELRSYLERVLVEHPPYEGLSQFISELVEDLDATGAYVPVSATKAKPYSVDANLFHTSYEGGILEDPWESPPEGIFQMSV